MGLGLAILRARNLGARVTQLVVHGQPGEHADGRDEWLERREFVLWPTETAAARRNSVPASAAMLPERVVRAMLFGDVKGFSKLAEAQIPPFLEHVMGTLAGALAPYESAIEWRNTWGDGLYVVIGDARAAAHCALDLQSALAATDLRAAGLPETLGLRLGAHAGPVFHLRDPVLDRPVFFGTHVTRTARIEPVTPPGGVYVTEEFAAALALDDPGLECEYVGRVPAAKGYGTMRMYHLGIS